MSSDSNLVEQGIYEMLNMRWRVRGLTHSLRLRRKVTLEFTDGGN